MTQSFDVIIIGAGVVGLSAALALAKRSFSVALMDVGPLAVTAMDAGRVYAINAASCALFHHLGIWPLLHANELSPYQRMHVWDAKSKGTLDFDAQLMAANTLGFIVTQSALKQALLAGLAQEKSVQCFPHCLLKTFQCQENGMLLQSSEGLWQAKQVIIADGPNSAWREKLKVPLTSWSYHQHALVTRVRTEKAHEQRAYQVFNPEGPLAFLPLKNAHECSIVWSTSPRLAEHLMGLSDERFNEQVSEAFHHKLGEVSVLEPRSQFPLSMRQASQYVGQHWVLMGDAAHTVHPLAGLGLNLGLADVITYLSYVDQSSPSVVLSKKQLQAYQRQRKHAVWQTILFLQAIKSFFGSSFAPLVGLRALGLMSCNQLPFLKRFFIEQAAGKALLPLIKAKAS